MEVVALLLAAIFFATPALFLAAALNIFAERLSIWLRASLASITPAVLFSPIFYFLVSEGDPSGPQRLEVTLKAAGVQFAIGFVVAIWVARKCRVSEDQSYLDQWE